MAKEARRLNRLFGRIERRVPQVAGPLGWLRRPGVMLIRIPLAVLLILGGIFSFLPVLGIWMLPLGLLLLAIDVPFLQRPVSGAILWVTRKWSNWRRNRRARREAGRPS